MVQLNICKGHNEKLMRKCPLLLEYATYVNLVQEKSAEMELDDAVEEAVSQCIKDGILADFLLKNRSEAIAVSIFEYDEEKELALLRAAEREAGVQQGIQQGIKAVVSNMIKRGMSDEDIIAITECSQDLIDKLRRE